MLMCAIRMSGALARAGECFAHVCRLVGIHNLQITLITVVKLPIRPVKKKKRIFRYLFLPSLRFRMRVRVRVRA